MKYLSPAPGVNVGLLLLELALELVCHLGIFSDLVKKAECQIFKAGYQRNSDLLISTEIKTMLT